MNRNIVLELILIVSVASIWISGALATQQYLDAYNTTFSTNATCSICHVNPAGGGTLNSYGMRFQNETNHITNPGAALQTIGQPSVATPTAMATITVTPMVTATLTATPIATATAIPTETLISTPLPFNATPAPTETQMPIETPVETPVITTPVPTPTPSTPGFGLGVFIAGLLACYFVLKRRNNN